jgi:hypothetical protein
MTFEKFLGTKMNAWLQGVLGTSVKAPVVAADTFGRVEEGD